MNKLEAQENGQVEELSAAATRRMYACRIGDTSDAATVPAVRTPIRASGCIPVLG